MNRRRFLSFLGFAPIGVAAAVRVRSGDDATKIITDIVDKAIAAGKFDKRFRSFSYDEIHYSQIESRFLTWGEFSTKWGIDAGGRDDLFVVTTTRGSTA